MTKGIRTGIFYLLVGVFFILGGLAVLYAQGWRFKINSPFNEKSTTVLDWRKVGGMYIRTFPENASISLDGETVKKPAGLFERGVLVNSLFPGEYQVVVEQDGYEDWSSIVPVRTAFVTSRSRIVLFPSEPKMVTSTLLSGMHIFGSRLAIQDEAGKISFNGRQTPGNIIVTGTDDGERIITSAKEGGFYWTDLQTGTSTMISRTMPRLNLRNASTTSILTIPQNSLSFMAHSSTSLRMANMATGQITSLEENATLVSAAASFPSRLAWTVFNRRDNRSVISFYDMLSGTFMRSVDFAPGKTTKLFFVDRNNVLLLQDNGSLYLISLNNTTRKELASGIKNFYLSPDRSSVAIIEKEGLSIFTFQNSEEYLFFRIPDPESVREVIWYKDKNHAFIVYPDRTNFLDFSDVFLSNFKPVVPTNLVDYSAEENTLYALIEGTLKAFRLPD